MAATARPGADHRSARLLGAELAELAHVAHRHDEEMAARVGIGVEHREAQLAAPHHQVVARWAAPRPRCGRRRTRRRRRAARRRWSTPRSRGATRPTAARGRDSLTRPLRAELPARRSRRPRVSPWRRSRRPRAATKSSSGHAAHGSLRRPGVHPDGARRDVVVAHHEDVGHLSSFQRRMRALSGSSATSTSARTPAPRSAPATSRA